MKTMEKEAKMISMNWWSEFMHRMPITPIMLGSRTRVLRAAGVLLVIALSGCACQPGYVGPYGGVHPGRCYV
jgi:hypothetical protein